VTVPVEALLAPVPEIYLPEGQDLCNMSQGRVAFGSRAWEVLKRFDDEVGQGAPVLIYASVSSEHRGPVVSWVATWHGLVFALNDGSHPDGDEFRPPSTTLGGEDGAGYWFAFWEVTRLHPLDRESWIPIRTLRKPSGGKFKADFIPEGPTLVGTLPKGVARFLA